MIYCIATGALWSYLRISFFDIPFRLTKALPYGYALLPFPSDWSPGSWLQFFSTKTGWYYLAWLVLGVEAIRLAIAGIWEQWNLNRTKRLTMLIFGLFLVALAKRCIHQSAPQLNYSLSPVLLILVCQLQAGLRWVSRKVMARYAHECSDRRPLLERAMVALPLLLLAWLTFSNLVRNNQHSPYQLINPRAPRLDNGRLNLDRAEGIRMPAREAYMLERICRFISENTSPSDPLFTLPFEGRFYFLADRQNATRFDIALNTAIDDRYQEEAIRDLELSPPPYIIHDRDIWKLGGRRATPNEERTPLLAQYLFAHYEPVFEIEGMVVMGRVGLDTGKNAGAD
jgi:hypothetical protein